MGRDLILILVLIVAIGGYVVVSGYRVHHAEARADAAQDKSTRLASQLREARDNIRVVTEYVDRVQVVRERGATIIKEVPIHVTATADARCPVPVGFVRVHDAAAQNLPADRPAGNPDAPAAGVALSTVAATVADNYVTCHATREQLIGLQAYVRTLQPAPAQ